MIDFISIMLGITVWINQTREVEHTTVENTPLYEGTASWYDYDLEINGQMKQWSKTHSTCALRIYDRYSKYKVCSVDTGVCIECYHNDFGPARTDRVIDLSSYAFRELGVPLRKGLTEVKVYKI